LPAAAFFAVAGWFRYGWWALLAVVLGLAAGVYGEWNARRRRRSDGSLS
jgi:hypothetical protein